MFSINNKEHHIFSFLFGLVCLTFYLVDTKNILFVAHAPQSLLWYSSLGLLLTALALLTENVTLFYTIFCASFLTESLWTGDFLFQLLTHHPLIGISNYLFTPGSLIYHKDFFIFTSIYHALIPVGLLVGLVQIPTSSRFGWVGATIFTWVVGFLSSFFIDAREGIDCFYPTDMCRSVFGPVYSFLPEYLWKT